jgi:hypothetical protein
MVRCVGVALALLLTALGHARPCCCWLDFLQAPAREQAFAAAKPHSCCGARTAAPAAPCTVEGAPRPCNCPTVKECSVPYREASTAAPPPAEFTEAGHDASPVRAELVRAEHCNAFDLPPPYDLCVLHHTLLI